MKTVFNNSEICHVFARQSQTEGKTSNGSMFFRNNVIYSYGYHFPMAAIDIDKNIVFFTSRTYSITTAKHLNKLHYAVSQYTRVSCLNPEKAFNGIHGENIKHLCHAILECTKNAIKGRIKSRYLSAKLAAIGRLENYLFYCPDAAKHLDELQKEWLTESYQTALKDSLVAAEIKESAPKEIAPKDAAKQAAKLERIAGKVAEYLAGYCAAWQADNLEAFNASFTKEVLKAVRKQAQGNNSSRYYSDYRFEEYLVSQGTKGNVLLRARNGNLETSKGIKIPLPIAERYYKQLKAGTLGEDIAGYKINKGNNTSDLFGFLFVGCHTLELAHIDKFAASQNWI